MTFDWNMIGAILLGVAALAVLVTLILWMCGKISDEALKRVWKKICYLVEAAEMMFGHGTGDRKLEWVLQMLRGWGIKITDKVLAMVEAAVMELTPNHVFDETDGETAEE